MATVLETFFAKIGFEVDNNQLQNAQARIAGVGKSILGLGLFSGLSIAGISKLVTSTAEAMGNIQRLSDRTGIATNLIAGMGKAGQEFGVTQEGAAQSLVNVNNALGAVMIQEPRAVNFFKRIGLSATDAAGAQKDVVTFLGDVADKIQGMPSGAQARILDRLGIDPGMISMLRNGRQAFLELYETASQGGMFPAEDYQRAQQFQQMFTRVKGIIATIGKGIALELMRPMMNLLDRFNKWWASNGRRIMEEMRGRLRGWGDMFTILGRIFSAFAGKGDAIVRVVEALSVVIGLLIGLKVAQWIGSIITAFGGWGAAILALGVLIYLIIDDYLAWKEGGASVIGYLEKRFPEAFQAMREGWAKVKEAFLLVRDAFKQFWAENGPAIKEFIGQIIQLGATVGLQALILSLNGIARALTAISAIVKYLSPITKEWWAGQQKQAEEMNQILLKVMGWWDSLGTSNESLSERVKNTWKAWGAEIQSDWSGALTFMRNNLTQWGSEIESDWNNLKQLWQGAMTGLSNAWDGMTKTLRSIWEGFMGWLEPWLQRIENFFNFVKGGATDLAKNTAEAVDKATGGVVSSIGDKFKGIGQKVSSWIPSLPSMSPVPEMAGGGGLIPSAMPSVTNAQKTSTMTQNNDVKATINLTAPSPEAAAEMTADKINNMARLNTRHGQSFEF